MKSAYLEVVFCNFLDIQWYPQLGGYHLPTKLALFRASSEPSNGTPASMDSNAPAVAGANSAPRGLPLWRHLQRFHGWKEHRQELTCGVAGRCRRPTENKILRLELDQKPKPLISLQKKTIKGNQGFWYFDHPEWRALHIPPLIIIIIHNNLQQPEPATDPSEASCSSSRIPALHRQPSIPSKLSFGGCRRVASEHGESSQEDLAAFLSTYGFVWK